MSCTFDRGMCVGWRRAQSITSVRVHSGSSSLPAALVGKLKEHHLLEEGATHIQRGVIFVIISILNYPLKKEEHSRNFLMRLRGQTGFQKPTGAHGSFLAGRAM